MNYLFYLFLVLIIPSTSLSLVNFQINAQPDTLEDSNIKFQNYEPPDVIKLQYPSTWNKIELPKLNGILFFSPLDNAGIIVQNEAIENISVDKNLQKEIMMIPNYLPNVEILNFNTYSTNNSSYHNLVFSFGNDTMNFKVFQIKKAESDRLLIFTYFAEEKSFDKLMPITARMLNSFTPLKDVPLSLVNNNSQTAFFDSDKIAASNNNQTLDSSTSKEVRSYNSDTNNSDIKFINYENAIQGIQLKYPNFFTPFERDNVIYLRTNEGETGFFIDSKSLAGKSLENFTTDQIDFLAADLENFSLINSTQIPIYSQPSNMIFFNYVNNSIPFKGLQFLTAAESKGYIFTFFSPSDTFDFFLPKIIDLVETINISSLKRIN